jgi:phenylpyruvate tautomerase PptA (4-oxalocrotonate tautomerase family)
VPIVDVVIVSDDASWPDLAQTLADGIGDALGAPIGTTWVRLRALDRSHYAESGGADADADADAAPVFVEIISRRAPDGPQLSSAVVDIVRAVARATGRPAERVHVIFEPDGAGRIAFGGRLVE